MSELRQRFKRLISQVLIGLVSFMQFAVFMPAQLAHAAVSSTLVISQVQTNGTTATDEFVELYNKTNSPISLNGWSLQYKGGGSAQFPTAVTSKLNFAVGDSVPAHGYFLIVNASASAPLLLQKDTTYADSAISLSNSGATLFLVNSTTALTDGNSSAIIDKVAYGAASGSGALYAEGTATAAPAANGSIVRQPNSTLGNGTDTDVNSADFSVQVTSTPRSSLSDTRPVSSPVLTVDSAKDGKVKVSWPLVIGADGYEYAITPTGQAFGVNTAVSAVVLEHEFTGLTDNTSYDIRVRAMRSGTGVGGVDEYSEYALISATPTPSVVVTPDLLKASVVYSRNGSSVTPFMEGVITVQATVTSGSVPAGDDLLLTLTRPGFATQVVTLTKTGGSVWSGSYVIQDGSQVTDETISASLKTESGNGVEVTSGATFTVNTNVSNPVVTVMSRCSTAQDSLTAKADSDVTLVYVSTSPNFTLANLEGLVLVAPVTSGSTTAEAFIGDNLFGTLYAYAKDAAGNVSGATQFVNDIVAPSVPTVQIEAGDRKLVVSWAAIADAKEYVFRYKKSGTSVWTEQVVTSNVQTLAVENGQGYDIAVASRDAVCNTSAFISNYAMAVAPQVIATSGRGGISEHEAEILARYAVVVEEKDGNPLDFKSPYSVDEDKDQNGIKDSEEDKDGNGIKDGEDKDGNGIKDSDEDKNGNGIKDSEEQPSTNVRDRSRLIVAIAILLIIAGAAIAAYSWAQSDNDTTGGAAPAPAPEKKDADEKAETVPAEEPQRKTKRGGKSKRKTRW
ncbi:MAG TPA: lamin tail domain-containing protein [Patescibacteria group bacterium]